VREVVQKYRAFYSKYKDKLFSYILYKCGDRETALDIVQDSFVRCMEHYRISPATSPSLLFTIARNALYDIQRAKRKVTTLEKENVTSSSNIEKDLITREKLSLVQDAMVKLSDKDRDLLLLVVNGLSYKDIAAIHKISVANVKVRVHRARMTLKNELEKVT
jgi:RNA polymerase sigma-70 factor (ECF subfamily)